MDNFPGLKLNQLTLPSLTVHSSPKSALNSSKVKLGGSLLITIFVLGAMDLTEGLACPDAVPFLVADAGIEITPLRTAFSGFTLGGRGEADDIVAD